MTISANRTKENPRILFLALSGIGNYIMQSPAIAAAKEKFPNSSIAVWVAPRGTKFLAENDPNVDSIIEMPIQTTAAQHVRQVLSLYKKKFDIGIVLSPGQLVKSAAYLYLGGITRRIGASYPFFNSPASTFLLTDTIEEERSIHDIEQNLRLLGPLGISVHDNGYKINVSEQYRGEATALLKGINLSPHQMIIGLHAGSAPDLAFKRWPIERFAEVAQALIKDHKAHILLFGGPEEEGQKEQLRSLIRSSSVTSISSSLFTTAAVMQRCRLMIANDSGLMHLAAAAGVETLGLFGPTSEIATGPRGKKSSIARAPGTKPIYRTEASANLEKQPHETILSLTVAMVTNRVNQILVSR
ncbi:MAG: glycosyltransferase family 9 protein [Candidatus Andersenbacteria bacterium]|nr:glycosyltransferase family 9 protein [Candidatus Andersenbacteria bacterium]MBI3250267.1 glycosyltransferase family 9 protein [Candidatus Andersenbacteria bacterium]